jgi:hypothetical protein
LVRDVRFDNIRIENIRQGSLFQVKVGYNQKYCKAPGRVVENVRFSNIRYHGDTTGMSLITGYDEQRKVTGVTFDRLRINGRHIFDGMPGKPGWYATSDYVPAWIGNHVEQLTWQ